MRSLCTRAATIPIFYWRMQAGNRASEAKLARQRVPLLYMYGFFLVSIRGFEIVDDSASGPAINATGFEAWKASSIRSQTHRAEIVYAALMKGRTRT